MARRRRHQEEHVNHEGWAIPYGDLITLLLAFFVVMYSISSVNEGKFRILSDSLSAAFRGMPMAPEPIQIGSPTLAPHTTPLGGRASSGLRDMGIPPMATDPVSDRRLDQLRAFLETPSYVAADGEVEAEGFLRSGEHFAHGEQGRLDGFLEAAESMARVGDEIQRAMGPLIDADLINVRRDRFWIEVEINTSLLFASGSAELFADARPVLEELAGILGPFPVRIHAEGFTDNVPINTPAFPSNWELSAGRAASVIRLFAENGLDPTTMAAIGFGEYRPIADNTSAQGRMKNRRVTLVILAQERPRSDRSLEPDSLRDGLDRSLGPMESG
jgi:chemotaxis protein MotB